MGKAACNIVNNIRTLRFDHGEMTQSELADKVGVTRQTIYAIEKNKYSPPVQAVVQKSALPPF
jgi:putative transcriptional regulator